MAKKTDIKTKVIRRKCVECGEWFKQEIRDYGSKKLTTDDYDEYCEACNQKAMRGNVRKPRKIKPYTAYWWRLAHVEMEAQTSLTACRDCGYPVAGPYRCNRCGCEEP